MSDKAVDVFNVDKTEDVPGDDDVIDAEVKQIVAAPSGWLAIVEVENDVHTVPVACFALTVITFGDNSVQTQTRAQVATLHGEDFGHIVDAEDLEGYIGLIGPTQNPDEVIGHIREALAKEEK